MSLVLQLLCGLQFLDHSLLTTPHLSSLVMAVAMQQVISSYVITETYEINNMATWNLSQFLLFCAVIWTGLEIMQQYVPKLFQLLGHPKLIEVRGKVLHPPSP